MPLSAGSPAPAAHALALARDQEAPEFAALGAPVELEALAAQGPAVLFFYKGDCGASDAAAHVLPRFAALPGVAVAVVSQDGAEETDAFSTVHRLAAGGVRVLVDPEPWPASEAYGVRATPTFVLLGRGRVEAVLEGWSRDDVNRLAARTAALAGAPPPVVSSPADGPAFRPG